MLMRVGLLLGDELPLRDALLARFAEHPAARAEMVEIGPTGDNHVGRYDVILDRISPLLHSYRSYLRSAALTGAVVVPSPTRLQSQDKLLALGMAQQLGIAAVRAVLLPQQHYSQHLDPSRALHNQQFPFRWDQALAYVGSPAELRACDGLPYAPRPVTSHQQLMAHYAESGERALVLQQAASMVAEEGEPTRAEPPGQQTSSTAPTSELYRGVRIGERAFVMQGGEGSWRAASLPQTRMDQLIDHTRRLSDALGYWVNAVDFAVSPFELLLLDGHQPLAVPFMGLKGPLQDMLLDALVEALTQAPDWRPAPLK